MFSRRQEEGTHQERHSYFKKRRGRIRRSQYKKVRLAIRGTMRSVSKARINAVMHWVGVKMAREQKREARKAGTPIHFEKGDTLIVISNLDEDGEVCEGMRLKERCIMQDRTSEFRDFIIVRRVRDGRMKQLKKNRFVLYARGDGEK